MNNELLRFVANPPNPYHASLIEWLGEPPRVRPLVYEEEARSIISANDSPDIGFEFSVNPYRGCFHGCAYCYARPGHQYLDFGAGTDFEKKLVVKVNAAELLRKELKKSSHRGKTIVFSGVTDCYQPLEATYQLTRECLKVCMELGNPVSIITKGALVQRDVDVLLSMHNKGLSAHVTLSIPFFDDATARKIEAFAPAPSARFRAMQALSEAGLEVGVAVSPLIPALNDKDIPDILRRAKECGASSAFMTLLRLPGPVKEVFRERLEANFPERAGKVMSQLRDMKDGRLNRSEFGTRMVGEGPRWEVIRWIFRNTCQELSLSFNADDS